jgi:hypothetical protein
MDKGGPVIDRSNRSTKSPPCEGFFFALMVFISLGKSLFFCLFFSAYDAIFCVGIIP